jgi:hypothetical protein
LSAAFCVCLLRWGHDTLTKPSFSQRIYLLWVFRHFQILAASADFPVNALYQESRFVLLTLANDWEAAIFGTLNPWK